MKSMTDWLKKYSAESIVTKAYEFAKEAHKDSKRASGEPYLNHCLNAANSVRDWGFDETSIAAALLHDVVKDTPITIHDIQKKFGEEIKFLVDGLTKLDSFAFPGKDPKVETFRKLIISFSRDLRVVIIKLADRLDNMQTLRFLSPEKQKKFAWETTELYAPLAYRLGMQKLSGELEDLAFPYIYPEEFKWLIKAVKDSYDDRLNYVLKIQPIVLKLLEDHGIKPLSIDARAKRYSSLYKKLIRKDMNLERVYDLVAFRIIVKTVEECYSALGIIHQVWTPLSGQIKDYIARPKPNGYRSLHTTVFCIDNKITEFQIRTQEMHEEDELGIAAHWAYQQTKNLPKEKRINWAGLRNKHELLWVEQLRNWQKNLHNQEEFIQSLKTDFFKDRIFVITPQDDVVDLPTASTPIDFAYQIHSELGNQCVEAKVNNKIVPLDYELHSGDLVEIIIQKGKRPSKDWLRFVKTALAQKEIKSSLRTKEKKLEKRVETPHMEFKIINQDRPGFLKDVTGAFAELKINITYLNSATDQRGTLSTVIVRCEILTEEKIRKLLVKLKKIAGTKEVNYKFNR